ncbi:MAG: hypothetical protein HKO77_02590 [Gemmatimonadetes bacterium]|nr:hypothetical protein [Gemmatimonadota bacterium]
MPHSTRVVSLIAVAPMALLLFAPGGVVSQAHPTSVAPEEIRHIQSISPQSGPPGTVVSLSTMNLPYEANVHVGVGAMGQGFEALVEAQQGRLGEIAVRVSVPEDTPQDRPIVFIAFNAIFAPIGMSDPFHVTDAEGKVRRRGEVVSREDDCVLFRDQDGYEYELTGENDGLQVGEALRVEGFFFNTGPCFDGPTIGVSDARPNEE